MYLHAAVRTVYPMYISAAIALLTGSPFTSAPRGTCEVAQSFLATDAAGDQSVSRRGFALIPSAHSSKAHDAFSDELGHRGGVSFIARSDIVGQRSTASHSADVRLPTEGEPGARIMSCMRRQVGRAQAAHRQAGARQGGRQGSRGRGQGAQGSTGG